MNDFSWQHIEFEDGGNSYICMTKKEFNRVKRKYSLVKIKDGFWLAKELIRKGVSQDVLMC